MFQGNNVADNQLTFSIGDVTASGLSIDADDLSSLLNARTTLDSLDAAIDLVNDDRSTLGALQNLLEFTLANLGNITENIQSSESTIRDTDFAGETADFARNQILIQAGSAMLAQANAVSASVLSLLQS